MFELWSVLAAGRPFVVFRGSPPATRGVDSRGGASASGFRASGISSRCPHVALSRGIPWRCTAQSSGVVRWFGRGRRRCPSSAVRRMGRVFLVWSVGAMIAASCVEYNNIPRLSFHLFHGARVVGQCPCVRSSTTSVCSLLGSGFAVADGSTSTQCARVPVRRATVSRDVPPQRFCGRGARVGQETEGFCARRSPIPRGVFGFYATRIYEVCH